MRIPRVAGVGLSLALIAAARTAPADPRGIEEALRADREGALSEAMAAFERALAQGGNDRASLGVIYLHLGVLRAGARDPEGATQAFEALLALDPGATTPAGSSPLVTEPFARARARRGQLPALSGDVRAPPSVPVGAPLTIDVAVRGDPLPLAHEARAAAGSWEATASGGAPFRLTLPGAATRSAGALTLRVSLHDDHGSVLEAREVTTRVQETTRQTPAPRERPARDAADVARVQPPDERRGRRGGGVLASPWFWGGAAVVVAGGVTAALLLATSSDHASFSNVEVRP